MSGPRLIVRDPTTGRVKNDGTTSVGLFFGRVTLGGAGFPQSGTIVDDRFTWAGKQPFARVIGNSTPTPDGYELNWSISGNTLTWRYPASGNSSYERPMTSLLYGVK